MPRVPDADLLQEALGIVATRPEDDRLRVIIQELYHRTTSPVGQQRFLASWRAGRRARADGVPLDACPYVEKVEGKRTFATAHRKAWILGWKGKDKGYGLLNLRRATMKQMLRKQRVGAR